MKYFLSLLFFSATVSALAQVPAGQGRSGGRGEGVGSGRDYPIEAVEAMPDDGYDHSMTMQYIREGKKVGLKRKDSILVAPIYDEILSLSNGYKFRLNKVWRLADKNGKIISKTEFDSIGKSLFSYVVKKNDKYGVLNYNGEVVVPINHTKILYANTESGYALVQNNSQKLLLLIINKANYIDFDNIVLYQNAAVLHKNGKQALLVNDKLIADFEYDNISIDGKNIAEQSYFKKTLEQRHYLEFREAQPVFILEKDKKFGVIADNQWLYPIGLAKVSRDGFRRLLIVQQDKHKGVYFISSKYKTDIVYDDIHFDGMEFIEIKQNQLSGMVDYQWKTIIPIEYDDIQVQAFNSGFKVFKNKKEGWTDKKGQVIIPVVYDEVDDFNGFSGESFKNLLKVKIGENYGVVDRANKIILPIVFDIIFERNDFIGGRTKEGKYGLYKNDGTVILEPEFDFIFESVAEKTKLLFAPKNKVYTIIGKSGNVIFNNSIKKYDYLEDEYKLVNPLLDGKSSFLRMETTDNKFGIFDERSEKLCLPFDYDGILQKVYVNETTYFIAKKGKKLGVVDNLNKVVIPFNYDDLSFDLLYASAPNQLIIPAKKGKKYGLIDFTNKVLVPFTYDYLQRVCTTEPLFKAMLNKKYRLMDSSGKILTSATFDDMANFENGEALTFNQGTMKLISTKGQFMGEPQTMTMHQGYQTFEDLKQALIAALDSPDDTLLMDFCLKIAPSKHILYHLKNNIFDNSSMAYGPTQEQIAKQYYRELYRFKKRDWNSEYYRKSSLTQTNDYTIFDGEGLVTNKRTTDWAFGDTRFMEKLLRNAIKINGYWISTYFMKRYFSIEEY